MRMLHNLYFTIVHNAVLNPDSFAKHLELTESMNKQRHIIHTMLENEVFPQLVHEYQLREIKSEQMNATMAFKATLCQQLLAKKFIIDDRLLSDPKFKAFFSLLPDPSRRDSYNKFIYSEKQEADSDLLEQLIIANVPKPQKVYKNKYDSCPHCGNNLTQGSVVYGSQQRSLSSRNGSVIFQAPLRVSSTVEDIHVVHPNMVLQTSHVR
jgi:hypothetical protein